MNVKVIGAEIVAKNIVSFGNQFINHTNKCMSHVKVMLDTEVTKNMNLEDHSLEELHRLGHPYRIGGPGLHEPTPFQVHKQSGVLLNSKTSGIDEATINLGTLKTRAYVTLDGNIAPYLFYVLWGTSKMIPRDWLTPSLDVVKEPAMGYLMNNLRDLVLSWKPKN